MFQRVLFGRAFDLFAEFKYRVYEVCHEVHMPTIFRVLFPTLSCFGPLLAVIGLQHPEISWSVTVALAGALMTSASLLMLFVVLVKLTAGRPDAS